MLNVSFIVREGKRQEERERKIKKNHDIEIGKGEKKKNTFADSPLATVGGLPPERQLGVRGEREITLLLDGQASLVGLIRKRSTSSSKTKRKVDIGLFTLQPSSSETKKQHTPITC